MKKMGFLVTAVWTMLSATNAFAVSSDATKEVLNQTVNSKARSDADASRDANRLPEKTLAFFGIEKDMKVLELMPGKGWYTKILAKTLNDEGVFYTAIRSGGVKKRLENIKSNFGNVKMLDVKSGRRVVDLTPTYDIGPFNLEVEPLDMVLTFRNYHNMTPESRGNVNAAVFKALKPGGVYAVIDHTRRHMEQGNSENRRRVDPVQVIKDMQASGFIFTDYSTMHYHPDDELNYEVGRKSVSGNTDRFTLKFIKPKQ